MGRRKDYYAKEELRAPSRALSSGGAPPQHGVEATRIDMRALLGADARFSGGLRTIDLSKWTGRGIDPWVFATVHCLKALLLSGARETASVKGYAYSIEHFFAFLTGDKQLLAASRPAEPASLSPLHVQAFTGWLQRRGVTNAWTTESLRKTFSKIKSVLVEMFEQGYVRGERSRYFPRRAIVGEQHQPSRHTSLSKEEQERLAMAIKSDLVAIHHKRLTLPRSQIQGLRLLVVAHRQGLNPTPLLEIQRDAVAPGFLPNTIRVRTAKVRNRKVRSGAGRAGDNRQDSENSDDQQSSQDLVFSISEGAVLQQAIACTRELVAEARSGIQNRVWLYRSQTNRVKDRVNCVTPELLQSTIAALVERHKLLGDDGKPLRLNLSRLRKSFFDRALQASDGDLSITANLMGNTPRVAGVNYPSMNDARQAEAAGFMNADFTAMMRQSAPVNGTEGNRVTLMIQPMEGKPVSVAQSDSSRLAPTETPVSSCKDTLGGEYAPRDGTNHCDRYVMCLFCSSFTVVGAVEELWRLFSFQAYAKAELEYLDRTLGLERTEDDLLEDLRDRYRVAVPYIDDFTERQFSRRRVALARAKTAAALHPYWRHQMQMSRHARANRAVPQPAQQAGPQTQTGQARSGDRRGA